ncbi:VWA domain-containing protein [Streptomyces sp. NPDC059679]|uniref:VWA domain-containing protein n=1 Tax=Streptomyces sp. NPDC059679 TaxID=3346903 RepID=UPI003684741A
MGKTLSKLKDLASRAGRWLGLAQSPPEPKATGAVVADRFDQMAWHETHDQAPALQELAEELNERYDYTDDLLRDVFLAAYKVTPQVRGRAEMAPSRRVNHQVITSIMTSPEFEELHRETAGNPYAAAMAVLAQADALRRTLEDSRTAREQAQQAKETEDAAQEAAHAVAEALQQATEAADEEGAVPDEEADAVGQAIGRAEDADREAEQAAQKAAQALAAAAPGIRGAVRRALAEAADATREEAALMRAWGVEPGQLERMPFEQRAQLAQRLRSGRLGRFAELIGRFRQMAFGERARRVENAPGELVGITLGDDLSRVIPSELIHLGIPAMRPVFAARYAEARLMLYDSRGEQPTGQGAIIACVDCSYSMDTPADGQPGGITGEAWAKAAALALLDQARQTKRDFVGILFASQDEVSVHRFPADQPAPIADVIEFAEHFYGGGTDYQAPLSAAVELLEAEFNDAGRQRGDIVMITDGQCDITEEWMRTWTAAKHALDFRCFGIAIGNGPATGPGSVLDALCDNLRSLDDLTDPHAVADIFRMI